MSEVYVIVKYQSLPDQFENAKQEIAKLVSTVLAKEQECGGVTLLQDLNDPTRFTLIEKWPSQELFLGPHMQQKHIQDFIQGAGRFLAGPPDITFSQAVGVA